MWRPFFCAIGMSALILGGEFLVIDRATLKVPPERDVASTPMLGSLQDTLHSKEFVPPEWAPWSLLSFGAVVVLYSSNMGKE